MSELVNNPAIGNVLSIVDLAGLILVYASLSRRMTRLERGYPGSTRVSTMMASSGPVDQDPSYLDLIARVDQLESEREIMIKKLQNHEIVLSQIVHEFKARAAGSQRTLSAGSAAAAGPAAHTHGPSTTPFSPQPQYSMLTPGSVPRTPPQHRQELTPSRSLGDRQKQVPDKVSEVSSDDYDTEPAESDDESEAEARKFLMGNRK